MVEKTHQKPPTKSNSETSFSLQTQRCTFSPSRESAQCQGEQLTSSHQQQQHKEKMKNLSDNSQNSKLPKTSKQAKTKQPELAKKK